MDNIVLQFLQNKLAIETSAIVQEHGFSAEKNNPTVFVSLAYDELLAVQQLVNEKLKTPVCKKELPTVT